MGKFIICESSEGGLETKITNLPSAYIDADTASMMNVEAWTKYAKPGDVKTYGNGIVICITDNIDDTLCRIL